MTIPRPHRSFTALVLAGLFLGGCAGADDSTFGAAGDQNGDSGGTTSTTGNPGGGSSSGGTTASSSSGGGTTKDAGSTGSNAPDATIGNGAGDGGATGSGDGGAGSSNDAAASEDGSFTAPPSCACGAGAPSNCAVWTHVFMTNYGFNDNSGSSEGDKNSADIAYPGYGPKKHTVATEGAGTYDDPITAASDTKDSSGGATLSPGTFIYNPLTEKYYILEDSCAECEADYACKYDDDEGTAAFPGDPPAAGSCATDQFLHIDFWMGPTVSQVDPTDLYNCEDDSTIGDVYDYNNAITGPLNSETTNGTVIVNPPNNLPVRSGMLFQGDVAVPDGGGCWTPTQVLPYQEWCN
jgi:hypothetical protein